MSKKDSSKKDFKTKNANSKFAINLNSKNSKADSKPKSRNSKTKSAPCPTGANFPTLIGSKKSENFKNSTNWIYKKSTKSTSTNSMNRKPSSTAKLQHWKRSQRNFWREKRRNWTGPKPSKLKNWAKSTSKRKGLSLMSMSKSCQSFQRVSISKSLICRSNTNRKSSKWRQNFKTKEKHTLRPDQSSKTWKIHSVFWVSVD